ncbi:MAG: hypothetical protein ABI234_03705 [Ktedonobacteraceae bacterium]
MYHIQHVDEGYQIFRHTTVQEYPPMIVSSSLAGEPIYVSNAEALERVQQLKRSIRQQLGRIVEITVQCDGVERAPAIQAACMKLLEPLQAMLEFLTFTDVEDVAAPDMQPHGMVHFLMRLLEPLTHADADNPLRDLLGHFLEFDGVIKAGFSFWIVEIAE